jgi:hypothetical protein
MSITHFNYNDELKLFRKKLKNIENTDEYINLFGNKIVM